MKKESKFTLTLTGVVIQDPITKGFTGYMLEIPEAIAEGNSEEEVTSTLLDNLKTVFEFKKEDQMNEMKGDGNYQTKSFELELS